MSIKIVLDNEDCLPYKKHTWDAGYDLRSNNETVTIKPGAKVKISTGVKILIPRRHVGIILPRSGSGTKFRVGLANTAGVIDHGYTDEVYVFVVNNGTEDYKIEKYDRFCQLLIVPVELGRLTVVDSLPVTARGDAGFGHSGVK